MTATVARPAMVDPTGLAEGRGTTRASAGETAHLRAIDARLLDVSARGVDDWSALLRATAGADPILVAERVRTHGLAARGLHPPRAPSHHDDWEPELHARDFEWYFEAGCARALASRVAGPDRAVLCLGAPTVAFALLDHPELRRVTLVDRNPLVRDRHAPRHTDGIGGVAALETIIADLDAARPQAGRYDAVVFDAPWYPSAMLRWLAVATGAVRAGGRIAFALLPALHRPHAERDRAQILAAARRLGPVTLWPGALRYQTPRFEHESMAAAGIAVPSGWRSADLVELRPRRPLVAAPGPASAPSPAGADADADADAWIRFVIGSQVVHLDPRARSGDDAEILSPIDGRPDFRHPSISTRHPRHDCIGLWTSRSRVARVGRPSLVAALLERLARTGSHRALVGAPELRSLEPAARDRLRSALRTIIGDPDAR